MHRDRRRVMCVAQQLPVSIRRVCGFLVQVSPISALRQTNVMNNPVLSTTFLSLLLFREVASPSGSQNNKKGYAQVTVHQLDFFVDRLYIQERMENTDVQMLVALLHCGPHKF